LGLNIPEVVTTAFPDTLASTSDTAFTNKNVSSQPIYDVSFSDGDLVDNYVDDISIFYISHAICTTDFMISQYAPKSNSGSTTDISLMVI